MPAPKPFGELLCLQARQGPVWRVCTIFALAAAVFLMVPMIRAQDACTDCHEDESDPEVFAESVHGFAGCVDCRTGAEKIPHSEEGLLAAGSDCHDDIVAARTK